MTKYSFILLSQDQEKFLIDLQTIGLMDITRSTKPIDAKSTALLQRIQDIKIAISKLNSFDIKNNVDTISLPQNEDAVKACFTAFARLNQLETDLFNTQRQYDERIVWGEWDSKTIKTLEDKGYKLRFYHEKEKFFNKEWENIAPLQVISIINGDVYFVTISNDPSYTFPINEDTPPLGTALQSKEELQNIQEQINIVKGQILGLKAKVQLLEEEQNTKIKELDMYLANQASTKAMEDNISIFEGFAPTENDNKVCSFLNTLPVYYTKEDAKTEDNPPIALKNNWFTKMFQVLTDMYGRPDYNEFDPTPYLSVFFLLFFAMCMGDAGYGLMLVVIGLLLKKSQNLKNIASLVITLGCGTIVIGIIMHTVFGVDIYNMPWVPYWLKKCMVHGDIFGFDAPMVLSVIIGIVHLCLAMAVKTIYATKNKGFWNSLGTWGWTTLLVGGTIIGGLTLFDILPVNISKWIIIVLGAISALGIFFLNDLHRNPLINFASGLWETYNTATGLLGDVLSYLRLYALGLAGGMLGQAFNQIAMMTIGNEFSLKPTLIVCILILLIGHSLNICMCCLGAFVHPLRLNFLEFFKNAAYDGKGRTYKPISK